MSRSRSRATLAAIAAAAALSADVMVTPPPASAGVIRHDRSDNVYRGLSNDYPSVGSVGIPIFGTSIQYGSGTLIAPRWVLTAGHVVDQPGQRSFSIGGTTHDNSTQYAVTSFFPHPSWNRSNLPGGFDIGLMKLSSALTAITPASRFTAFDEVGRVGTSVGFGTFGEGDDTVRTQDGRKRAGRNVIDALGLAAYGAGWSNDLLAVDFDDPGNLDGRNSFGGSTEPLDLEYCVAPGDSGGGMFADAAAGAAGAAARPYLAGVHSFVEAPDPPDGDNEDDSDYSDTHGSTRVSAFNAWVDDQITVKWTNAAGGAFAAAGNWSPAAAPDAFDVAGFNTPGGYAVTFAANAVNDRLIARAGDVTLNLGGNAYTLQSATYEGSLIVGRYAGNVAALTVTNGVLTTREAVLAEQPGSTGRITVGNAGTWNVVGDVYAGGNFLAPGGAGAVVLNAGSNTSVTGNLKLYAGGSLTFAGGSFSAAAIDLAGGTIAATAAAASTLATPVAATAAGGTLRADAPLTLTGAFTTASGAAVTKTGAAALAIAGPQSHAAGAALTVAAGTLHLNSNANGNLTINANAATRFASPQNLAALHVADTVTATLAPGASNTLKTAALSVAGAGRLDVTDNAAVIDYAGDSVQTAVRGLLLSGYDNGTWTGPGIMSSAAGASGLYTVGYGEAADVLAIAGGESAPWRGQLVDATSILVMYTYGGDTNFDGKLDADDYGTIDFSVLVPGSSGYHAGDFNWDGVIDADDYGVIDFNILAQEAPIGGGGGGSAAGFAGATAVPEPSAAAWLVGPLAFSAARRRRGRRRAS